MLIESLLAEYEDPMSNVKEGLTEISIRRMLTIILKHTDKAYNFIYANTKPYQCM